MTAEDILIRIDRVDGEGTVASGKSTRRKERPCFFFNQGLRRCSALGHAQHHNHLFSLFLVLTFALCSPQALTGLSWDGKKQQRKVRGN